MEALVFNLTTAALLVVMFKAGVALVGPDTVQQRRIPWFAVGLTVVAIAGVVLQLCWGGAMDALDSDPSKAGWWRVLTSVFMQNGGVFGTAYNLATIAVIAALAEWFWGGWLMLALFLAGDLLPQTIGSLFGETASTDPRNFAGSSGSTYFLAATLAGALLLRNRGRGSVLLALAVPALGLAMWFAQENGHGLVSVYGFVLGLIVWALGRRVIRPDRDLTQAPRTTVGTLTAVVRKR
ncbi:hypothetical protein F0L68_18575 [Solihabitans fulvus]|uniref:Rhomboid family intramembrane serine protease n=2 Tax=Solihabitans fulvus TaxID=1892852 RepID=A0A5B2XBY2_9PSEU|nr:hypothetical protein F0L68_18575 [Solihabitans fulvus]